MPYSLCLTANTVNGSGNGSRSGAQTLVLLAMPLNCLILRALADAPKQQAELRGEVGSPPQTTLRAQLKKLTAVGTIAKHRRDPFPGVLDYELTAPGHSLLFVASVLERWLGEAPQGPLPLGDNAAKAAVKALAEGWSTTMLRALAAGPLSLTELDRIIGSLSYPSLERRLAALRLAGQVEARRGNGRGTPYAVTDWLRQGVAPLAAAARWERCHLPQATTPFGRLDTEAAFLLAVPLLRLAEELSGTCRMAMELPNGAGRRLAGVTVEVRSGRIASCITKLEIGTDAWALGSPAAWLDAVIEGDSDRLELGGDDRLACAALGGLHEKLFGVPIRKTS
jgi:DNA-binding HxlR family transcriptional regulator